MEENENMRGVYAQLSGILEEDMLSNGKDKLVQKIAEAPDGGEAAVGKKTADYGWSLAENEKYVMLGGKCEKPVLGIAVNAMHKENAKNVLEYFWKNE